MTFKSGFLDVNDEEREKTIHRTEEPRGQRELVLPGVSIGCASLAWVTLIWEPDACVWGMQVAEG